MLSIYFTASVLKFPPLKMSRSSRSSSIASYHTEWTCEGCLGYPGHRLEEMSSDNLESLQSDDDSHPESDNIQLLASPLKHDRYFFNDGNVTLLVCLRLSRRVNTNILQYIYQVEGTLYKIHWYLLQRYSSPISSVFFAPHDLPEDTPILLPVTSNDFELFLSILYPV
jgi:hypothetical protein